MGKPIRPSKLKKTETSKRPQKLQASKAQPRPMDTTAAMQPEMLGESPLRSDETVTGQKALPKSRTNSKLSKVVEMLRAPEGASIADIMKATDWQAHSVRGAIAGAIKKKLGLSVNSERRGDERFYRIAE